MALTETAIVNMALRRAQVTARLSALDTDTTKEAKVARDLYDYKRDHLLRSHAWNFAKTRVELPTVTPDNTLVGYDYAFTMPSDALRVLAVSPVDEAESRVRYKIETVEVSSTYIRVILTNSTTLFLRYIRKVETVDLFDPSFTEAFTWDLAKDFALAIRESTSQAEFCDRQCRLALASARSTNGIEDWPDEFPLGSWVSERFVEGDNWAGDSWA